MVEIIILISIVSVIVTGVLAAFVNVITINKTNEYYSQAYKILDSKIEELRSEPFSGIADSTFSVSELPGGTGTVTISNNIEGQNQDGIVEADVTVSWNFKKQTEVKASTYISNGGLKK